MRVHKSLMVILALIVMMTPVLAQEDECKTDDDCVPASCCHATESVPKEDAPDCEGVFCTMIIQEGTLDVGEARCLAGECFAIVEENGCPNDKNISDRYCEDNKVVKGKIEYNYTGDYDCSNETVTTEIIKECEEDCQRGQCVVNVTEPQSPNVSPLSLLIGDIWDWIKGII